MNSIVGKMVFIAALRGQHAEIGPKTVFLFEMDFLKNYTMDFVV